MTDPRFPRLSDPMIRRDEWTSGRDENVGGMWSWVAGVSLLLLIGFLIFAGWNSNSNTANSGSSPSTTTASRTVTPPSTTGSGSSSPQPITPAPSSPAPSKSGTQ
jgi:hypothetical protein